MKKKLPQLEKELTQEIKKEERVIFHHFIYLKKHHQVIFASLIVLSVVFIWRGLWDFMNLFWFPQNQIFSNLSGIFVGFFLLYLSHRLMKQLVGE